MDRQAAADEHGDPSGLGADWWRGAVIYQIYPRSFADADGNGVGDLAGVISRLDHVASLGVDGIWLSPFFPSPMKDFGYDVSDYRDVDPLFGTLADFDALVARAHALGLKVVIDQVWSHTSNAHPWFVESASSRDNPKAEWYVWADAKADGSPPNNWQASFGGPSWTWNARRRQYYLHNFLAEQPDLNFWNLDVQDAILDAGRFWLDRGVDGFRLDVINFIVQDRTLRDNPVRPHDRPPVLPTGFQRHVHDRSRPEALAFLGRLRALLDSYGALSVGEVVDDPPLARQKDYVAGPDRLHTAYSFYLLLATAATPALFADALRAWGGADGWPSWSLGNHDVPRFPTRLAHSGDPRQVKTILAALMCLRGTIFLYQGEELGLPQAHVPFGRLRDPFAIAAYAGGSGRDGARTPMPWTAQGPGAGFSTTADTWLPIDPDHRPLAVDVQEADGDSMLHFTRKLIALRRASPALRLGAATVLDAPPGVLAFERSVPGETLLCVFELAGHATDYAPPAGAEVVARFGMEEEPDATRLPAFGAIVFKLPLPPPMGRVDASSCEQTGGEC
ncbi:MAG: alpha-amylase family glycosyl hydrolase [Caulobacteraceae bacterium]